MSLPERYHVESVLGRGGMGQVLLATDQTLGRRVAIKVLLENASEETRQRFVEEAQVTSQLSHPNIVAVHDLGLHGDELFLALRFVQGVELGALISRGGVETENRDLKAPESETDSTLTRRNLSLAHRLRLFLEACDALAYVHERGIVHRDLKPANMMVSGNDLDHLTIMDWGLARPLTSSSATRRDIDELLAEVKREESSALLRPSAVVSAARANDTRVDSGSLTQEGAILGTPSYMPPEQVDNPSGVDQRADIYAMGSVLYEILTGAAPYQGSAFRVIKDLLSAPPPPPSKRAPKRGIPPELEAMTLKAMARNRDERYASIAALARDLRAYLDNRSTSVYSESPAEALRRQLRRYKGVLQVSGAAAFLLIVTLLGLSLWVARRRSAAEDAEKLAQANIEQVRQAAARSQRTAAIAGLSEELASALKRVTEHSQFARQSMDSAKISEESATIKGLLIQLEARCKDLESKDQPAAGPSLSSTSELLKAISSARRTLATVSLEALVLRDPDRALQSLEQAELPESRRSLLKARALLRLEHFEEAAAAVEEGLAARPSRTEELALRAVQSLVATPRQPQVEVQRRFDAAIAALRELERPDFEASWLFWRRAQAALRLGGFAAAAADLELALRAQPFDPWAIAIYAQSLGGGMFSKAHHRGFDDIIDLAPAGSQVPRPERWLGVPSDVVALLEGFAADETHGRHRFLKAWARVSLDNRLWGLAARIAEAARAANENDPEIQGILACALARESAPRDFDEAALREKYSQAQGRHRSNTRTSGDHIVERCATCRSAKMVEEVLSKPATGLSTLAGVEKQRAAKDAALAAVKLDPDQGYACEALGWLAYRSSDWTMAKTFFRRAAYGRCRQDLLLALAQSCLELGDGESLEEGIKAARRAIAVDDVEVKITFNNATELHRREPRTHRVLAELRLAQRRPAEAMVDAAHAVVLAQVLSRRGKGSGDRKSAIAAGYDIIDELARCKLALARSLSEVGLTAEARLVLEVAISDKLPRRAEMRALLEKLRR